MSLTREEAYNLVVSLTPNKNLVKHMLAVEASMRGLARKLQSSNPNNQTDENLWGLVGLLHDADYEKYPKEHPREIIKTLKEKGESEDLINAIEAHAWKYNGMEREPQTKMEWAIYTCDELTGLIIAVTLIRPTRKIADVTVENVLSKWEKKDFAKGVNRDQIAMCEEKLGIKLEEFIEIVLKSMQEIASTLGL